MTKAQQTSGAQNQKRAGKASATLKHKAREGQQPEAQQVAPATAAETQAAETKPAEAPKKAAKVAKPKPEVDAFGNGKHTKAALICAALTSEPQSMKAIMAAAGQSETFYNLLNRLVAKGLVCKTEKGFSLPAAKA